MNSHLTEPACIWRDRRDQPQADTHMVHPGDKVTLCTARRVWTVTSVHGHEATITAPGIDELLVHVAHLERVEADPDEHGEIPGQEALDLGDVT